MNNKNKIKPKFLRYSSNPYLILVKISNCLVKNKFRKNKSVKNKKSFNLLKSIDKRKFLKIGCFF